MNLKRNELGLGTKPGLLVVDVIKGFTDPACPLGYACPEVVTAVASLLGEFHIRRLPVFLTTVVYRDSGQARVFRDRIPDLALLTPESPWIELDERLPKTPGDKLIEKQWASAFHATNLDQLLSQNKVDSLVVTGLTTSGCVRATVVDGLQNDYPVVVPREAVGDRNAAAHEANLFDMQAKYADVWRLKSVIKALPRIQPD